MTTLTFDTHDIIKKFREKGLSEDLAEFQVEAIKDVVKQAVNQVQHDYNLNELATKKDLDSRITETELKIELVRADLKRDIAETKAELIRWVVGVGLLQTALIAGLVIKLAGVLWLSGAVGLMLYCARCG